MVIFHGSKEIVSEPRYGYGRKDNDYGQGFYCTEDYELAAEWACQDPAGGFVNSYDINTDGLKIFSFEEGDIMSWLALLLSNRRVRYSSPVERMISEYITTHFVPDVEKADIIKGYRADDSYFTIARAFLSNTITLEQLGNAMKLGKLGHQICIKSRKAFERIFFRAADPVEGTEYFPKRENRDKRAREDFVRLLESGVKDGIFARDILDKEMKADELRI